MIEKVEGLQQALYYAFIKAMDRLEMPEEKDDIQYHYQYQRQLIRCGLFRYSKFVAKTF